MADVLELVRRAERTLGGLSPRDRLNWAYYDGTARVKHMGIAIPPELRNFELSLNWARLLVDTYVNRQDVQSLLLPGQTVTDRALDELWTANDLEAEIPLLNRDVLVTGRGFISVGSADDGGVPLLRVESPSEVIAHVDPRTRRVTHAVRIYQIDPQAHRADGAVVYLPDETIWLERSRGGWRETARDEHNLGMVPIVPVYNRRRSGRWAGTSELVDVIPFIDAATRALTNLQVALETLAFPKRFIFGVANQAYVDKAGNPVPMWEAYINALAVNENADAKAIQLSGADLSNFHNTLDMYARHVAALTGFPHSYLGVTTQNPPAEGAIRAQEAQLTKTIIRKNAEVGSQIGHALALAYQLHTGKAVPGARLTVLWHDPGTPTFSQRADAIQKLAGGIEILSREGAWAELGFSDMQIRRERAAFAVQEGIAVDAHLEDKQIS